MCGIVGAILKNDGGFFTKHEGVFYDMLHADTLRGWDSTGIIGVEKDTTFHIAKEAVCAADFISPYRATQAGKDLYSRGKAAIGHNRKKTSGKISDETAHPFVIDSTFAMVHNGTLHNHSQLAETEVDSQALAIVLKKAFDEEEYIQALEEQLGKVYGAYALAMYDQKRNKVFLLRNVERPLTLFECDDAYYFCSEPLMGWWLLTRNGYEGKKITTIPIDSHKLYEFDLDAGKQAKLTTTELTVKKSFTQYQQVGAGALTKSPSESSFEMTKREFKTFRNRWLGKRISFWVDDYVEDNYPRKVEDGEVLITIWGRHEEMGNHNSLCAEVDITPFEFNKDSSEISDRRWTGVVEAIELSEKTQGVLVTVAQCKPIAKSFSKSGKQGTGGPTIEDYAKWTREIETWSDQYLEWYKQQNKSGLKAWQIAAINQELNARDNSTTYHDQTSTSIH